MRSGDARCASGICLTLATALHAPCLFAAQVPDRVGPLEKVRDRKYGRTWIAVYAPPLEGRGAGDDNGDDDGLAGLGLMVGSDDS